MAHICKANNRLRREILTASYKAKACHIGSALSCIDIIMDIFSKMKPSDYFIFSKASGAAALYVALSEIGVIPKKKVVDYLKKYPLASKKVPGVLVDSGSLGHGLPIACGLALSDKNRNVYVLMSDGELQEGTTWESLLFKKQHKLDNLIIYVDCNGFQACGKIKDILDLPYRFLIQNGFHCIATKKGWGVDFMEDNNNWHYKNLDEDSYSRAILQLAD